MSTKRFDDYLLYKGKNLWIDPVSNESDRYGVLLSDQIAYYARKDICKLIYPFDKNELRPASYTLHVGNRFYKNENEKPLNNGEEVIIKPNDLVFIRSKEFFNIPYYMIGRYSLRVHNVYRGLVLDNGLHIDPGYHGFINVPIYNFTNEEKRYKKGEKLLSIEFIRTTRFDSLSKIVEDKEENWIEKTIISNYGEYILFQNNKCDLYKDKYIRDYFYKDEDGNPIDKNNSALIELRSQIESNIQDVKQYQENTDNNLQTFRNQINRKTNWQWGAIATFIVSLILAFYNTTWLNRSDISMNAAEIKTLRPILSEIQNNIDKIGDDISSLNNYKKENIKKIELIDSRLGVAEKHIKNSTR